MMNPLKISFFSVIRFGLIAAVVLVIRTTSAQDADNAVVNEVLDNYENTVYPPQDSQLFNQETAPLESFPQEAPPIDEAPADTPPGEASIEVTTTPTSEILDVLELKDMDIGDVLKLISKRSGLNIVAGNNVQGKVTIYLKDVEVREALRIILQSYDLAFEERGGIIRVMPAKEFELKYGYTFGANIQNRVVKISYASIPDVLLLLNQMKSLSGKIISDGKTNTLVLMDLPDKLDLMEDLITKIDVPIQTEVFELSYAKAKDIAEKLVEVVTPGVGRIKFDERSNKIVVTDAAVKIKEIEEIVLAFDVKQREVLMEAKIIQIILSDEYKMGVDWEAIVENYHNLDLVSDFDLLSSTEKRGKLSIGTIANDDYKVLLEALETVGVTNILSSPRITALNNEEAKILVGSTQPYVTTTTTTPASGPSTTSESVNFIDVGVKLFVTPTIHTDDFITMKIKPEVSSVTSQLTTSQNNTIPIVETSEAETTVTVKDGITIVIGGLMKEEKIDSIKKIPVLGDIPFLGIVFRNESDLVRKTELVIFLTPKIITGDVASNQELGNLKLLDKDKSLP